MQSSYEKNGLVYANFGGIDAFKRPASGSTPYLALDTVGTNHGIVTGATLTESDTAMLFDGNDYVQLPRLTNITQGAYSIVIPIRFVDGQPASIGGIFGNISGQKRFYLRIATNGLVEWFVGHDDSNFYRFPFSTTMVNGDTGWKQFVITENGDYSSNSVKLYLDGTINQSATVVTGTVIKANLSDATLESFNIGRISSLYTNCIMKNIKVHNKELSQSEITTLYNGGTITSGLVLDMPLNQANCRSSNVIDVAGNAAVTSSNVGITSDHNGRANRGWALNGTSAYIEIPSSVFDITDNCSITIATKYNSLPSQKYIIGKYLDSNNHWYLSYVTATRLIFVSRIGGTIVSQQDITTTLPNMSNFIFLTLLIKSGNINSKLFIDGSQKNLGINTNSSVFSKLSVPIQIGLRNAIYLSSEIDYIDLRNKELSLSEHQKLYNFWRSH